MEYQEDLGFQIRTLSHLVKRTVDQTAFAGEEDHPTGVILKLFNGHTYSLQSWADELQAGIHR